MSGEQIETLDRVQRLLAKFIVQLDAHEWANPGSVPRYAPFGEGDATQGREGFGSHGKGGDMQKSACRAQPDRREAEKP